MKKIIKEVKKLLIKIKEEYLLVLTFIIVNLINSTVLRAITVRNTFSISPFFIDFSLLLTLSLFSLLIKRDKRIKYFMSLTILFTIICIINSVYYNYYNSFASVSLLATAIFAKDVSDAIFENVLKIRDFVYLIAPVALYIIYRILKKRDYFTKNISNSNKKIVKKSLLSALIIFISGAIFMPMNSWNRLIHLWNREAVVINFGVYVYQFDDFIQSLTPHINNLFGYDSAVKKGMDYYKNNPYIKKTNEYTDIFKGKNVIVIHAESLQTFPMYLSFNGKEVTPNLNKLAREGMFFSNFYSEVGVGTSSDAEFTFNTSLMPSTKGTVFVNYFNREYVSFPKLLKEQGYYTFSMHANNGDFWNRNIMHKTLGYDDFYSKDSYVIDETIGLGLSDKSFFSQSVKMIKNIKETKNNPYYGLLIMLTNHTPFSDLELIDEYKTTVDVEINSQTITRKYLEGTIMGNYLRSVHYADQAISELIEKLDKEKLLDNTVLVIYGDHDARLPYNNYNTLYNYNPETDTLKNETDEGYIPYNEYTYELDRKVPFIIWTKDKKYNLEVKTAMGMIDVLPTLGNMLGVHSDYQLGTDIFNVEDNMVTFIDGSFVTNKIYYNAPKGEIYSINNEPVMEEYVKERADRAIELIEVSNAIISYDLIKEMSSK